MRWYCENKTFIERLFRVHITLRQAQVITDSRLFVCYQRRLVILMILSEIPNKTVHRLWIQLLHSSSKLVCFSSTTCLKKAVLLCGILHVVNVKLSVFTPWRHVGRIEANIHTFFTAALDEGEWKTSRPGGLFPGKERLKLNRRLDATQSRSEYFGKDRHPLPMHGFNRGSSRL